MTDGADLQGSLGPRRQLEVDLARLVAPGRQVLPLQPVEPGVPVVLQRHAEHWSTWDARDPDSVSRACAAAIEVLADLRLVRRDPDDRAVRTLPLAHRYRAAVGRRTGGVQLELT